MRTKTFILMITAIFVSGTTWAQIIHVPGDKPTIQDGINFASDGDTVLVDEGTYYENIRYFGKAITVASHFIMDGDTSHISKSIIDGSQPADPDKAAVVMFMNGEDTTSIIQGFTIKGGLGVINMTYMARTGGGIYSFNAGCKILNNVITENHVEDDDKAGGAGVACIMETGDFWTVVRDNTISYNTALADGFTAFGGGMAPTTNCYIENNLIEYNTCTNTGGATDGGGIELEAIQGQSPVAYIRGNTIQYNELNANTDAFGAGIICDGFTPEINDNEISNNSMSAQTSAVGGGILVKNSPGPVEIINNTIKNNTLEAVEGAFGGGIRLVNIPKLLIVSNNIISANVTEGGTGAWGGAISGYNLNDIIINNNFIENNISNAQTTQAGGGGIYLLKCGKTTIANNEIYENEIVAGSVAWGGGILIDKGIDTVFITSNLISDNITEGNQSGFGGGVCFYGTTDIAAIIKSNFIINNYANYRGGGICARNLYRMNIINNLFEKNESTNRGGAIVFYETSNNVIRDEIPHPLVANNTFVNNTSLYYAGALYTGYDLETPVIYNSIFWGNSANSDPDVFNAGSENMELYNNNIDTENISTDWIGEGNIFEDPLFVNSGDHPYQINDYSPCIDAGTPDTTGLHLPEYDLAGEVRIFNDRVDIGAYEWNTFVGNQEFEVQNSKFYIRTYPNPFTCSTTIEYELQQPATVEIVIYDYLGKQVEIIEKEQTRGKQQIIWNAEGLPAGVYFCVLKTESGTQTMKMIKMK